MAVTHLAAAMQRLLLQPTQKRADRVPCCLVSGAPKPARGGDLPPKAGFSICARWPFFRDGPLTLLRGVSPPQGGARRLCREERGVFMDISIAGILICCGIWLASRAQCRTLHYGFACVACVRIDRHRRFSRPRRLIPDHLCRLSLRATRQGGAATIRAAQSSDSFCPATGGVAPGASHTLCALRCIPAAPDIRRKHDGVRTLTH